MFTRVAGIINHKRKKCRNLPGRVVGEELGKEGAMPGAFAAGSDIHYVKGFLDVRTPDDVGNFLLVLSNQSPRVGLPTGLLYVFL